MEIDVAKHISELLYEKDKVIVPNLGGFCSTYKPADTEKYGNISPPSKEVYFDEALNVYDDVLIQHIADKNQVSYQLAKLEVESFVYQVKNTIVSNAVVIANIGRLYLDVHNSIVLAPSSVNFLEDAFGLPKVSYYPVSRRYEENNTAINTIQSDEKEKMSIKTFFSNLWGDKSVRAVLVIIGILMIAGPQLSKLAKPESKSVRPMIIEDNQDVVDKEKSLKPFEKTTVLDDFEDSDEVVSSEKSIDVEKAELISPIKVINQKEPVEKEEGVEKSVEVNSNEKDVQSEDKEPKIVIPTPQPTISYSKTKEYVVSVGMFSVQEFAVTAARDIRKAGYAAYVKTIEDSYRVGIKVSCEPSEIDDQLEKIKKEFPQAWLMNRD
jgi:cell division septation protein DedD/nucleoid DNA-binding protein